MGFFSNDCLGCGHPLLSSYVVSDVNRWMTKGVAITPSGDITTGEYDGYGRLDDHDAIGLDPVSAWHRACWVKAGKPTEYQGPSKNSDDQGFFFEDGAHDMSEPT